jgi:hypothetical protein
MTEHFKQIVRGQYEAALSMLKQRIDACSNDHWEDSIGRGTFRQDAYHVLFWADYYLTPHEDQFTPSMFNERGGDELRPVISEGLEKADTLAYVEHCHNKVISVIASETQETLEGGSGFPSVFKRYPLTRAELHLYNIRHVQHHTAQLSLHLRRLADAGGAPLELPWVGTGWK